MKKKSENWVYLFDKYKVTEDEAEEYVTKDPDLSSSELRKEESDVYSMVEYYAEEAMIHEYLKNQKEEQIQLLGYDPDDYKDYEDDFCNLMDENDPEQTKEEGNFRNLMNTKLVGYSEEEIQAQKKYEQEVQEKQEVYEKEKLILEERKMTEYIQNCHQDLGENSKKSSDSHS